VAEGAPRDFWEAIQLWHIATNMIIIESNGTRDLWTIRPLFYPFYKADIEAGRLSRLMQELIEHAFLKMHQLRKIRDKTAIVFPAAPSWAGPPWMWAAWTKTATISQTT
jgi:formate C-acetyltransferase